MGTKFYHCSLVSDFINSNNSYFFICTGGFALHFRNTVTKIMNQKIISRPSISNLALAIIVFLHDHDISQVLVLSGGVVEGIKIHTP